MTRDRLDKLLVERGHAASRDRAQRLIMAGTVQVAGRVVDKPGALVAVDATLIVSEPDFVFVSRGGLKLDAALHAFALDVHDAVVLDVGASTGGFTDCVLRRGARAVIAVDVGYGQFAWSLRHDPRVTLLERTNIRHLSAAELPAVPTVAVVDVSFISLRLVLPPLIALLAPRAVIVTLVKPQFEVGPRLVGKGGVVRDPHVRAQAVKEIRASGEGLGLECRGELESPVPGPKGNREVFLHFEKAT